MVSYRLPAGWRRFQPTSTSASNAPEHERQRTSSARRCRASRRSRRRAYVCFARLWDDGDDEGVGLRWLLHGGSCPNSTASPLRAHCQGASTTVVDLLQRRPDTSRSRRRAPARCAAGRRPASAATPPVLFVTNEISASTLGICAPMSTTNGACFTPRSCRLLSGRRSRRTSRSARCVASSRDSVELVVERDGLHEIAGSVPMRLARSSRFRAPRRPRPSGLVAKFRK